MKYICISSLLLLSSISFPCFSQQQSAPASDSKLAAYSQLLSEANDRLVQQAGALSEARQKIEELQKKLAEMEKK
jgi:hypothetical protein